MTGAHHFFRPGAAAHDNGRPAEQASNSLWVSMVRYPEQRWRP